MKVPFVLLIASLWIGSMAPEALRVSLPQEVPASRPASKAPVADPKDVNTIDGIIAALYDGISGPAGMKRNWDRQRTLFTPDARLIAVLQKRDGTIALRTMTNEDYIKTSGPFLEEKGFFEKEVARSTQQFGRIATVFSTYESRMKAEDAKPFQRGINSIQLVNDGTRWWVVNLTWDSERPGQEIPEKYLPAPAPK